jgi:hypothetical protein
MLSGERLWLLGSGLTRALFSFHRYTYFTMLLVCCETNRGTAASTALTEQVLMACCSANSEFVAADARMAQHNATGVETLTFASSGPFAWT